MPIINLACYAGKTLVVFMIGEKGSHDNLKN